MKFTSKTLQTQHESLHDLIGVLTGAYQILTEGQEKAYRQAWEKYTDEVSAGVYSVQEAQRRLREARRQADADFDAKRAEINSDLVQAVKQLRAQVENAAAPRAERALRISNALRLLEIEGKRLTDTVASGILKDFIADRDFDAMETFYRVIQHQVEPKQGSLNPDDAAGSYLVKPSTGETRWPETFGELFTYRRIIGGIDELAGMAEKMYMHNRTNGEGVKTLMWERNHVPMDGYLEPYAEVTAPEMAKDLEAGISAFLDK